MIDGLVLIDWLLNNDASVFELIEYCFTDVVIVCKNKKDEWFHIYIDKAVQYRATYVFGYFP